ncbi:MAG: hypothetical protein AAGK22_20830 [Acidobacteriota bacterium]
MSKYSHAKHAIEQALEAAGSEGWDKSEVLQALVTSAVALYQSEKGSADARQLLRYELDNISDRLDLDFIRSR